MRIGVNALYLIPGGVGGTEIYLRNLLRALAEVDATNEYFIFRNRETGPDLIPQAANFYDVPQNLKATFRPARILWEQIVLPFEVFRLRLDVLFNAGFTAPLLCTVPMATMFYDLQYKRHPEYFRWFDLPFWRLLLPASAARSKRIVAMSAAARADLIEFYPWSESRIDLVPHAVEAAFSTIASRRALDPLTQPLLLAVSTLHPHKNLDTLLRGFAAFRSLRPEYQLVVVGLKGFESERLHAMRQDLRLEDSVEFTGWIERSRLYELFATARAFVYPSRFEGFGIPVLEALAAGLPTACSRIPSLLEIAGGCARFFDPDSADDLCRALEDVTGNDELRGALIRDGLQRALDYSWAAGARKLVESLQKAAGR